jgi:hypothetical protein
VLTPDVHEGQNQKLGSEVDVLEEGSRNAASCKTAPLLAWPAPLNPCLYIHRPAEKVPRPKFLVPAHGKSIALERPTIKQLQTSNFATFCESVPFPTTNQSPF